MQTTSQIFLGIFFLFFSCFSRVMETHSSSFSSMYDVKIMPKQEYGVDFESFTQIDCPLLDYDLSGYSEYSLWDYHNCGFPMEESPFEASPSAASAMEAFVNEAPLYSSMDIEQSHTIVQECNSLWGFGNGLGELNGATSEEFGIVTNDVEAENHTLVCNGGSDNMEISNASVEDKKGKKSGSGVEEKCCISKTLSRETVSKYFYMPISQAAKELNIGLTLLKKRCRELGIRRWPHRKLMSLETLIKNVQELGKNQGEGKIREAIKLLENERKLLLRTPDLQLDETTKRLRQACFKANYKKRRLVGNLDSSSSSSNANSSCVPISTLGYGSRVDDIYDDDDEEIKSLISDCCPSSSVFL